MNKKLLFIPALLLIGALTYSTVAQADEVAGPWHDQMITQLSAKLGVSEDSVSSAMSEVHEQQRAARQSELQTRFEERLQAMVDEGKLTKGQMDAWLAKHEKWQAEREAERLAHHQEMQAWFAEQGIDPTVLGPMGMGMGRGDGPGLGMHHDW